MNSKKNKKQTKLIQKLSLNVSQGDYLRKFEEGLRLFYKKKYTGATEAFLISVQFNNQYPKALYYLGQKSMYLGESLRKSRQYEQAFQQYQKSLLVNPKYWRAFFGKGCLIGLSKFDQAIKEFQNLLYLKPKYIQALNKIGIFMRYQATAYTIQVGLKKQQTLKTKPYLDSYCHKGIQQIELAICLEYFEYNLQEEAFLVTEEGLKIEENNINLLCLQGQSNIKLGKCLIAMNRTRKAIGIFKKVLSIDEYNKEAKMAIVQCNQTFNKKKMIFIYSDMHIDLQNLIKNMYIYKL